MTAKRWGNALPSDTLPDLQPYQFWAVLELSGYKNALDNYVNGLHGQAKVIARAKLDKAVTFRRDNELVEAARIAIGLTDEQLDQLWEQAAAIT